MAQIAQPSGDLSVGYWSNQAGQITNLYASVNENPADDLTYIQSAETPVDDYVKFLLSGLQTPESGDVIIRIRAQWGTIVSGTYDVAFVWDAVIGATSYILQVRTSDSGAYNVFNSSVGDVLTYTLSLTAGVYYARVVPVGAGDPTAEWMVTVP